MGLTYGPRTCFPNFSTSVRYTGSSLSSTSRESWGLGLAPYIATYLAKSYGLQYVGYYLSTSAVLTFIGLLLIRETKETTWSFKV